jgi:hypothetical protein
MLRFWRSCAATKRIFSVKSHHVPVLTNSTSTDINQRRFFKGVHNNRNDDGLLNKTIRISSHASRSSITLTVGKIDKILGTTWSSKIFSFQSDFVKGFWRWVDACEDVKNVLTRIWTGGFKEWRPKYYREHVHCQLLADSMRGLPVIMTFFVPGGFVILGVSLFVFPTWLILPRTFWNRAEIYKFISKQHEQRRNARPVMLDHLHKLSSNSDILAEMYRERNMGNRHYLEFDKLKPLCQGGGELALDNLPLDMLTALAAGHGLYFSPKLRSKWFLRHRLRRRAAVIKEQDKMIKNELLIGYMTQRELDWACFRRGLNPKDKLRLEQESFLREWLRRSARTDVNVEPSQFLLNIALLPRGPKLRASIDNTNNYY